LRYQVCGKCGKPGHNARTCKPEKAPKKRSKPSSSLSSLISSCAPILAAGMMGVALRQPRCDCCRYKKAIEAMEEALE
jgi:hypothetical protein